MNKLGLLSILLLASISVNAQITLTQNDLPVVGSAYILGTDTLYSSTITAGGPNQNWDYSNLINGGQDSLAFLATSASPYASSFPLANMAAHSQVDSLWTFFINTPTGFYVNGAFAYGSSGAGGVSNVPLIYNPSQLFEPAPFTYGNTRNDVSRIKIDLDTLGQHIRFIHRTVSVFNADGYGSLILPNATYANTMRIKTIATVYDSVFVDALGIGFYTLINSTVSQSSNYRWFRNGQPAYLLGLDGDSLGIAINYSEYLLNNSSTGIAQPTATIMSVLVYPNPAIGQVNFVFPEMIKDNTALKIYDAQGRLVHETEVDGITGYGFSTNNMENGLYFYSVTGSEIKYNGRFVILH